ncbi:MAG: hypothetical protein B6D68_01865 [spirochete symbiont of Stewartia floridana]|nr:MAG: hypothetical protein B6D68_01865 [spirochete symbiont of Stewartia floridana]
MAIETKNDSNLMIVLSVLGVLSVALIAGLLLMQKKEGQSFDLGTVLSFQQENPPADSFDPISWAREGTAYPPLQESPKAKKTEETALLIDYNGDGAIPKVELEAVQTVESATKKAVASKSDVVPKKQAVKQPKTLILPVNTAKRREITENAYWIQVFSSEDQSRAEDIRDELAAKGLSSIVQVRNVNGTPRYRIRLGAFSRRSEAEYYALTVRKIPGYESSFVVIAPVTRNIGWQ